MLAVIGTLAAFLAFAQSAYIRHNCEYALEEILSDSSPSTLPPEPLRYLNHHPRVAIQRLVSLLRNKDPAHNERAVGAVLQALVNAWSERHIQFTVDSICRTLSDRSCTTAVEIELSNILAEKIFEHGIPAEQFLAETAFRQELLELYLWCGTESQIVKAARSFPLDRLETSNLIRFTCPDLVEPLILNISSNLQSEPSLSYQVLSVTHAGRSALATIAADATAPPQMRESAVSQLASSEAGAEMIRRLPDPINTSPQRSYRSLSAELAAGTREDVWFAGSLGDDKNRRIAKEFALLSRQALDAVSAVMERNSKTNATQQQITYDELLQIVLDSPEFGSHPSIARRLYPQGLGRLTNDQAEILVHMLSSKNSAVRYLATRALLDYSAGEYLDAAIEYAQSNSGLSFRQILRYRLAKSNGGLRKN